MSEPTFALIERLRADVKHLRERKHSSCFRWLDDLRTWRWQTDVADDIEAALNLLTNGDK